jgi:hypothetical protein
MRKILLAMIATYAWKWLTAPKPAEARRHDQPPKGGRAHR